MTLVSVMCVLCDTCLTSNEVNDLAVPVSERHHGEAVPEWRTVLLVAIYERQSGGVITLEISRKAGSDGQGTGFKMISEEEVQRKSEESQKRIW